MIIARSPMRISLGGGGTDLPSYYERFGGFVMAAAIDKYMYMTINQSWSDEYFLKYSAIERTKTIDEIQHPIFKAALSMMQIGPNIELVSVADIPAGTGLGSSGSFTTALLKVLHVYKKNKNVIVSPHELAEQACNIEIDMLNEPVGKQDQYIAAFGGVTCFEIEKSGFVKVYPAQISQQTLFSLEDNLVMFFTGYARASSKLLKEQDQKSKEEDAKMLDNLHYVKDLGLRIKKALESGQLQLFGELMHEHWMHKKQRSKSMSNNIIDDYYEVARKNGAVGGKLVGAGGGGFLLFYTESKRRLREKMAEIGLHELRFRFDFEGTRIIV
jgi:D-glycero-alpha-D-manno-heptose-7-phosphate kinase